VLVEYGGLCCTLTHTLTRPCGIDWYVLTAELEGANQHQCALVCVWTPRSFRSAAAWQTPCKQCVVASVQTIRCASVQAARAKKLELQSRVSGLENDLKEASKLTPSQLRAENGQSAELNQVTRPSCCMTIIASCHPDVAVLLMRFIYGFTQLIRKC
jgi:hypothetical protein